MWDRDLISHLLPGGWVVGTKRAYGLEWIPALRAAEVGGKEKERMRLEVRVRGRISLCASY